mgnify:CR=1 FL=1
MKRMKCYIYTRVSTSMQVDGYSLDAQKDKLRKYAEFQNMLVAGEYCDEGKSGKNIEGRTEFLRMLRDIESGKDGVCYQRVSLDDVLPGEEQLRRIEAIADPYAMQPQSIMEEQESAGNCTMA